jgi:hypothetical protein
MAKKILSQTSAYWHRFTSVSGTTTLYSVHMYITKNMFQEILDEKGTQRLD